VITTAPAIVEYGSTFRNIVTGIIVGPDHTVWANESGGVVRLTPSGDVMQLRRHDSPPEFHGFLGGGDIGAGPDGTIWTTDQGSLLKIRGGSVQTVNILDFSANDRIQAFAANGHAVFYATLAAPGLFEIRRDGRPRYIPLMQHIAGLAAGKDGSLWLQPEAALPAAMGLMHRDSNGKIDGSIADDFMLSHRFELMTVAADGSLVGTVVPRRQGGPFARPDIVRVSRAGAVTVLAREPYPLTYPDIWGIAATPDGSVWFTEPGLNRIAKIDPSGKLRNFRTGIPMYATPQNIGADRDGSVWFTDTSSNTIEHVQADGTVRVYGNELRPINTPGGPVVTNDGTLWFRETLSWHPRIARIDARGVFSELPDPTEWDYDSMQLYRGRPAFMGFSQRSGRVAYTIDGDGSERRISLDGCVIALKNFACFPHATFPAQEFVSNVRPQSAVLAPDGNIWFTDIERSLIGRITPNGVVTTFTRGLTRFDSGPQYITVGPDGALWFTEMRDRVGRVTLDGRITEFSRGLPFRCFPGGIVAGRDGNLWFTIYHGNELVRITPSGTMTRFRDGIFPSRGNDDAPDSIPFVDSHGRIWLNESQGGRIARATLPR
jgi:streptogramin lyase